MTDALLTKTRIRAGVWEGVLAGGPGLPALEVRHLDQVVPGLTVTELPGPPGQWAVRLPIPAALLSDGVQTFVIREAGAPAGGQAGVQAAGQAAGRERTLAHFTIITGVAMEDDLRAEIDLLRAELDLLKRAFRRHCVETAA